MLTLESEFDPLYSESDSPQVLEAEILATNDHNSEEEGELEQTELVSSDSPSSDSGNLQLLHDHAVQDET